MPGQIEDLRENAERFRRLAAVVEDTRNRQQLIDMASELDRQADKLEAAAGGQGDRSN